MERPNSTGNYAEMNRPESTGQYQGMDIPGRFKYQAFEIPPWLDARPAGPYSSIGNHHTYELDAEGKSQVVSQRDYEEKYLSADKPSVEEYAVAPAGAPRPGDVGGVAFPMRTQEVEAEPETPRSEAGLTAADLLRLPTSKLAEMTGVSEKELFSSMDAKLDAVNRYLGIEPGEAAIKQRPGSDRLKKATHYLTEGLSNNNEKTISSGLKGAKRAMAAMYKEDNLSYEEFEELDNLLYDAGQASNTNDKKDLAEAIYDRVESILKSTKPELKSAGAYEDEDSKDDAHAPAEGDSEENDTGGERKRKLSDLIDNLGRRASLELDEAVEKASPIIRRKLGALAVSAIINFKYAQEKAGDLRKSAREASQEAARRARRRLGAAAVGAAMNLSIAKESISPSKPEVEADTEKQAA